MKKAFIFFLTVYFVFLFTFSAYADVYAPEAYMGFSVSEDWIVFSENMENSDMLKKIGTTPEKINQILKKSDCVYLLKNPTKNADIYVKLKKNEVSNDIYSFSDIEDDQIRSRVSQIINDCFFMDTFRFEESAVEISQQAQMKFLTVPGVVSFEGKDHGMLFGATFMNGTGVAFMMYLDNANVSEEDKVVFSDIASSVHFTVIKEKDSQTQAESSEKHTQNGAMRFIFGGFAGLFLVAICLYLSGRNKKNI